MLDIKLKLKPGHSTQRSWMKSSPLKSLFWNVTYACNYRCDICFTNCSQSRPDELDFQEAKTTVKAIHDAGIRDVLISGGEPFMRPDMVDILKVMADFEIDARIASNGSLLNEKMVADIRRDTRTQSFQISLDALDPDLYGRFHGCSFQNLKRVLDVIDSIQRHGFHTTVSTRLTPETLSCMEQLLDVAYEKGWSTVTIHCPVHLGRSELSYTQDQDVISLLVPVLDHFCQLPAHWLIETYIPWAEYHPVFRKLADRIEIVHRGCAAGRDRLTLNPAGDLSPCVCMDVPDAYVGHINHDDLKTVFEQAELCVMMRNPPHFGICTECGNIAKCGGGCRASAFSLTGQIDGRDMACPIWQRHQRDSRKPNER